MFLYGVDCSDGYSDVNVFEYSGNLLCFVSKECGCNPFILLVGILFGVVWFITMLFLFNFCFMDLFGTGSVVCSMYFIVLPVSQFCVERNISGHLTC